MTNEREAPVPKSLPSIIAIVGALLTFTAPALADPYPTRTVEIIVSYGAGGSTDFVARALRRSSRKSSASHSSS
jgi:tripartite-type tricarboxylate transporter receptor subunit TctC